MQEVLIIIGKTGEIFFGGAVVNCQSFVPKDEDLSLGTLGRVNDGGTFCVYKIFFQWLMEQSSTINEGERLWVFHRALVPGGGRERCSGNRRDGLYRREARSGTEHAKQPEFYRAVLDT